MSRAVSPLLKKRALEQAVWGLGRSSHVSTFYHGGACQVGGVRGPSCRSPLRLSFSQLTRFIMLPSSILFNHRGHREHGGAFQAEKNSQKKSPRLSASFDKLQFLIFYSVLSVSSVVSSRPTAQHLLFAETRLGRLVFGGTP